MSKMPKSKNGTVISRVKVASTLKRAAPKPIPGRVSNAELKAFTEWVQNIRIGNKTVGEIQRAAPKPIPGRVSNAELEAFTEWVKNISIGGKTMREPIETKGRRPYKARSKPA